MIYFVRDHGGVVKIGYSADPWARFSKIQSDSPSALMLAAVVEGERDDEARLHRQFDHLRLKGEWFSFGEEIAAWISAADQRGDLVTREPKPERLGVCAIAKAVGISSPYVSLLLSGHRPGSPALGVKIFRATGVRIPLLADATDAEIEVLEKFSPDLAQRTGAAA